MGKQVDMIELKLDKIYARTDLGVSIDITEYTGILSMVEAALPHIQTAFRGNITPFKIYVDNHTLFAMNKVIFDTYVKDAVRVYFTPLSSSKPMAIFVDVDTATPPSTKKGIIRKLNEQIDRDKNGGSK